MSDDKAKQFDPAVLDSLHEAIGDGINHIISIYVDDFPNSISTMRQAVQQKSFETVERIAHSLKSSSGNLGALQLVTLSLTLEQSIRDGLNDEAAISAAIDDIEKAFQQVQPRLISYVR